MGESRIKGGLFQFCQHGRTVRFSLPGTLRGGGGRGLDITVDPPLSTHHLPFVTAREEAFSNQQAAFPVQEE